MILSSVLLSLAAPQPEEMDWKNVPVQLVDGGFCVGLAWVTLKAGEAATVDYGPDFNVYRLRGPEDAEWGIYSGFAGESKPDRQHALLKKNGVVVYRGLGENASFNGYFVEQGHAQNHFFGTTFKDDVSDSSFFERVSFGPTAKTKCESHPEQ